MYDDDYNEEEVRRWEQEGGKFLLENGIIDTADLEEVKKFKRKIEEEEEEIEKIDNEGRRPFKIVKLNERSDNSMYNDYDDDRELIDEIREFYDDEELDSEFEKAVKKIPPKLIEGLKQAFKILNEYSETLEDYPNLKTAMKYIGKFVGYPYPSGKGPEKYPYPSKVKKAMGWQGVQDLLFGGHIPADDEEIEKSSRENPFPSITRAICIKKGVIDEIEEEMEEDAFNPDDRRI